MWFNNKKPPERLEETAKEAIRRIEIRLTRVEAEILDVATAQDIIRNKVLRKLPKQDNEAETKDLYNGVLIAEK
jgi:hypothetical protein